MPEPTTAVVKKEEKWRLVDRFPHYLVSSFGRIKNKDGKILTGSVCEGYPHVGLCNGNGLAKMASVHRIVAEAFIPNPDGLPFVNHINSNRMDASVSNLEWCSASYNIRHGLSKGSIASGERSHHAKLTAKEIYEIRKLASTGIVQRRIAERFNISYQHTSSIINNKTWKYVSRTVNS